MVNISYDQLGAIVVASMGTAIGLWKVIKIIFISLRKITKKDSFLSLFPEEILKKPVEKDTTYLSLSTHKEMCMSNLMPIRTELQWIKDELVENRHSYRDLQMWYNSVSDRLTKVTESIRESMDNAITRLEAKIDSLR